MVTILNSKTKESNLRMYYGWDKDQPIEASSVTSLRVSHKSLDGMCQPVCAV